MTADSICRVDQKVLCRHLALDCFMVCMVHTTMSCISLMVCMMMMVPTLILMTEMMLSIVYIRHMYHMPQGHEQDTDEQKIHT
jgi:hypothetical protein